MFKEYLNKNCYVCVSFSGVDAGPVFYHGLVTDVSENSITLENVSASANALWLKKRRQLEFGKTTINTKYIILISEEI